MELSFSELKDLLTMASEEGANKVLIETGVLTKTISKAEAYRMYSRPSVDRWIREGLITVEKDGLNSSKGRIDRMEIERVSKTSNRMSWFNQLNEDDIYKTTKKLRAS